MMCKQRLTKEEVSRGVLALAVLLADFSENFRPVDSPKIGRVGPQWIGLNRCLDFGIGSLKAIGNIFKGDGSILCCLPICRAFYEASSRQLWASREDEGTEKLQYYHAVLNKKWANAVLQVEPSHEHAQAILKEAKEVISRRSGDDSAYDECGNMERVLDSIEKADVAAGEKCEGFGKFQYNYIYRLLSNAVHGHSVTLGTKAEAHYPHILCSSSLASLNTVRAFCFASRQVAKDVEQSYGAQILHIMNPPNRALLCPPAT